MTFLVSINLHGTPHDLTDLTQARAELWIRLDESVCHTPRRHMLLVAGDVKNMFP